MAPRRRARWLQRVRRASLALHGLLRPRESRALRCVLLEPFLEIDDERFLTAEQKHEAESDVHSLRWGPRHARTSCLRTGRNESRHVALALVVPSEQYAAEHRSGASPAGDRQQPTSLI